MTPGSAIKAFCLECVGASTGRAAFDCLSQICPLHICMPFRGKLMPKTLAVPPGILSPEQEAYWENRQQEANRKPKRRPSVRFIHAQCRQCQPGDRTDCEAGPGHEGLGRDNYDPCPLYPYRPWSGPGHAPKRKTSAKQRRQRQNALALAHRLSETPEQKPS